MYDGVSPEDMVALLQQEGYQAKLDHIGDEREPVIRSAMVGIKYAVGFYGRRPDGRATSLSFSFGMRMPSDRAQAVELTHAWNAKKRFLKCYTDEEGDLYAGIDFSVVGVSEDFLKDMLSWWETMLTELPRHYAG